MSRLSSAFLGQALRTAVDHTVNIRDQARLGGGRMDVRAVHANSERHVWGDTEPLGELVSVYRAGRVSVAERSEATSFGEDRRAMAKSRELGGMRADLSIARVGLNTIRIQIGCACCIFSEDWIADCSLVMYKSGEWRAVSGW